MTQQKRPNLRGANNPNALLTARQVEGIRQAIAEGYTFQAVADHLGISRQQVSRIAKGESWPQLTEPEIPSPLHSLADFDHEPWRFIREYGTEDERDEIHRLNSEHRQAKPERPMPAEAAERIRELVAAIRARGSLSASAPVKLQVTPDRPDYAR